MSLLINLLPDIRQAKLKERRRRQLATGVSVVVWIACGAVVVLLSLYSAGQKVIIANYNKSIADKKTQLQGIDGLIDAMTAQQHLAALPGLYDKRTYLTKFFGAYSEANPSELNLLSMTIDEQNLMVVTGKGKTYASVAKLARALEVSNVKVGTGANETNQPYFTNVNITSVSSSQGINFTLTATLGSGVVSGEK